MAHPVTLSADRADQLLQAELPDLARDVVEVITTDDAYFYQTDYGAMIALPRTLPGAVHLFPTADTTYTPIILILDQRARVVPLRFNPDSVAVVEAMQDRWATLPDDHPAVLQ